MKLKPLGDRLVVKPAAKEEKTATGIILTNAAGKESPEQGEVIAIGPGRLLENGTVVPMTVKVGDKVMFKTYNLNEVKIEGVDYVVISESDVFAIAE